jgi:hypothetical protein
MPLLPIPPLSIPELLIPPLPNGNCDIAEPIKAQKIQTCANGDDKKKNILE